MIVADSCNDHEKDSGDNSDYDYGWDLSLEEHVNQLLSLQTAAPASTAHSPHGHGSPSRCAASPARLEASAVEPSVLVDSEQGSSNIVYPDLTHALTDLGPSPLSRGTDAEADADQSSPLARFRTAPRKPLSVSDLTAGAWCELQYEYTLTRLPGGRRTRTAAMRAGTKVHARLEEEVHTTVRVDVVSREDVQGLKLWNMIQGVRTLRETGLTRELDVWGVVDGQIVSGIIDAISFCCPDPSLEAEVVEATAMMGRGGKKTKTRKAGGRKEKEKVKCKDEDEANRITDYFSSPPRPSQSSGRPREPPPPLEPVRKAYITDIKTRGSSTLPSGAAVRPTKIQLFLYHRFLAAMAAGRLDYAYVFQRYSLDPDAAFSDAFLAQMGELHDEIFSDADSAPTTPTRSNDAATVVAAAAEPSPMRYGTLRSLARLLQDELALTFPHGADSLGRFVVAEYRLRPLRRRRRPRQQTARQDGPSEDEKSDNDSGSDGGSNNDESSGRCIGTNVIPVDDAVLDRYLDWYLQWWRGLRPATGVDIEEASLKCGYCEFADGCGWRSALDEERVRRVREKLDR
ncbi:hypothetical protein CMQ_4237 [Grosmannia clavigera kw1407]|uniref:Defects in morphology protein 1 n=1 Tax=Grosmannia clavigera (strain kw1407 / UAMH 11150) TaxID=655863 RepID=F0X871_GROCL|nr:uncharacterized protein CMQ_4237 [Grosmannia clavigera kw1407]EFX06168.1 hypothetical protein CMQ_4237 [Grosmannia clavigera kw1407]